MRTEHIATPGLLPRRTTARVGSSAPACPPAGCLHVESKHTVEKSATLAFVCCNSLDKAVTPGAGLRIRSQPASRNRSQLT